MQHILFPCVNAPNFESELILLINAWFSHSSQQLYLSLKHSVVLSCQQLDDNFRPFCGFSSGCDPGAVLPFDSNHTSHLISPPFFLSPSPPLFFPLFFSTICLTHLLLSPTPPSHLPPLLSCLPLILLYLFHSAARLRLR